MTRRLAKKVLGHPFGYPVHQWRTAVHRWSPANGRLSRAARRADRVLTIRYKGDASRWLGPDGDPPQMYRTPKQGPPPKRATAP